MLPLPSVAAARGGPGAPRVLRPPLLLRRLPAVRAGVHASRQFPPRPQHSAPSLTAAPSHPPQGRYLSVEDRLGEGYAAFRAQASQGDEFVFPLVAARLAADAAAGAARHDALEWLCFARSLVADPPPAWTAGFKTLRAAYDAAGLAAPCATATRLPPPSTPSPGLRCPPEPRRPCC